MSRAVIFGWAGETTPLEVRDVTDEHRQRREDRGDAEDGWVNAHKDHLWPKERERAVDDDDWLNIEADNH